MAKGDLLLLDGLQFWGKHGAIPEEHILGQKFIVDIEVAYDMDKICRSDDLNDGLSYTTVFNIAKRIVTLEEHQLIEKLAQRIADEVRSAYHDIDYVKVTVKKPFAPIGHIINYIGVTIIR